MAIWLRAREEFADNRFQLLFIYIDNVSGNTLFWCADVRRESHYG